MAVAPDAGVGAPRHCAVRRPGSSPILLCPWRLRRHRRAWRAAENQEVISFPRALALVSGQNPQIAFANEQINEAFAQLRGARVLWLPSIQAGINYQNHDGPLQNSDGTITVANRSALEAGLGMYAVGGGAPAIPGRVGQVRHGGRGFPASHRRPAGGRPATRGHGHHP